ncbi:hypothetical protein C8Q76DRAFT_364518 [Earliella scabrosa]|nr:hypothetical protein C8Q76DRAFT_364518 [Earliella scabrosa]
MGQWWQLINVDRREVSKQACGELATWLFYPHEQLMNQLSIPCLPKEVDDWLADGPVRPPVGPIAKLPIEAIDLLFDQLHELHEVIYLAITCKSLLTIGKRHLLRATKQHYAPWAGCRLISIGDSTRNLADLPPHLLTDAERKEVETTELASLCEFGEYDRSLSNFASELYKRVFHMDWRMELINTASRLCYELERSRFPPGSVPASVVRDYQMFSLLHGDGRRATFPDGTRVLCNLSKGEYVREDGLTVPSYANLAHALLARICWSSALLDDLECEGGFKERLAHGPWAGDRFCITTLELLPGIEEGRAWQDVTQEVHELLSHIWDQNSRRWTFFCIETINPH